ncbi:MAG: nuclease [Nitrospira sp. WS238]|nr:nuclease [Nitrospira sp. WS238]
MRVTHSLIPKTCEPPAICFFAGLVFSLLLSTAAARGAEFAGEVVGVTDGDTIKVLHEGKAERIRLSGIDCPEKKQPFGSRAKQFTSEHAFGKTVTVQPTGRAHRGRTIAEVILPNGRSLNQELLKAGLAWWFRSYSKDMRLGTLEQEARLAKHGLWADPHPVPPWEFRRTAPQK